MWSVTAGARYSTMLAVTYDAHDGSVTGRHKLVAVPITSVSMFPPGVKLLNGHNCTSELRPTNTQR